MLRRTLEKNPNDDDARWNYEFLKRQQDQQKKNPQQKQKNPQSRQPPQPQNSSPQQQQPNSPGQNPPHPGQNPSGSPQKPQSGQGPQEMSREQADQLLGALQELARADQQRQRKVRVLRERRGKDW